MMKTIPLMLAMLLATPAISAAESFEHVLEGRTLYRLQVEGLVCAFCAYSVEQKLQAVAGVEYVDVDLERGRVMVGVAPGHELNETEIRQLIENAGFRLTSMEIRPMSREELIGTEKE